MPAGQSKTGIFNIAAIELGEDPINAPTDPYKIAILASARYDDVRVAVLRDAPWNCAKVLAQLAPSPTAPPFRWASQYPLPADCVRVNQISDDPDACWEVVGQMLMTDNSGPLPVCYGRDLTDATLFDPGLAQCIGLKLALVLAPAFHLDRARIVDIQSRYDGEKRDAMFVGSQENSPRDFGQDVWLRSRA